MLNKRTVIAVFGWQGMVGGAVYNYFNSKPLEYELMGIGKSNQTHKIVEVNDRADWIFICVPTPFNWDKDEYDISIVKEILDQLVDNKRVIIKSTLPPGTTEQLQEEYPNLYLFFNPEFLSEATCDTDFINPDRQIVGYTKKSYKYAITLLNLLPESPYSVLLSATEAEIVKYVNNMHGSMMVMFANFFYDVCKVMKCDFEKVKKSAMASKWVGSPMGRTYWNVDQGGFRGYGGKCFPKDMNTLVRWANSKGIDTLLLSGIINANKELLDKQNLTEQEVEKKSSRR